MAEQENSNDLPLSLAFTQTYTLYNNIINNTFSTTETEKKKFNSIVSNCIQQFYEIERRIVSAGLFSVNEELDDIKTEDLKYFAVSYYMGELLLLHNDMDNRLKHVKLCKACWQEFLARCERVKIIHKADLEILHRERKPDPATNRAEKIARLKREKEIRAVIEKFNSKNMYDEEDEESETREYRLLLMDCYIRKVFDQIPIVDEEIEILTQLSQMDKETKQEFNKAKSTPPNPTTGGRPTVTITERDIKKLQVFQDPNPPVLDLDTFLAMEAARSNIITGGGPQSEKKKSKTEKDEDESDEATYKARQWDDWKDDNPSGSGRIRSAMKR